MRQLGKALGIMARADAREHWMQEDVDLMGAPSECHALVGRGEAGRLRQARRHARAVSGLSRAAFNRELRRLPPRLLAQAAVKIYARHYPF